MRKESNKKGMKIALISLASIFLLGGGIAAGILIPLSKAKINHTTNGGSGNWNPSLPDGGNNSGNNPSTQYGPKKKGTFQPENNSVNWSDVKIETFLLNHHTAPGIYYKSYSIISSTNKNINTLITTLETNKNPTGNTHIPPVGYDYNYVISLTIEIKDGNNPVKYDVKVIRPSSNANEQLNLIVNTPSILTWRLNIGIDFNIISNNTDTLFNEAVKTNDYNDEHDNLTFQQIPSLEFDLINFVNTKTSLKLKFENNQISTNIEKLISLKNNKG